MSRIASTFAELGDQPALIGFITAGDPTLEHTVPAMHALVAGGVDIIELGVPFSDPEAEGPAIQASSERALENGVTLHSVLEMLQEFRLTNDQTPVVLMGYLNSFLAMAQFAQTAATAGADGTIIVNLPPEETTLFKREYEQAGLDLILLVAPTSSVERRQYIANQASGFVYYVSLKGITGANHLNVDDVRDNVAGLKEMTSLPVCVGFGIKDAHTAGPIAACSDGVVVGSALVNLMAEHADDVAGCATALEAFSQSIHAGIATS